MYSYPNEQGRFGDFGGKFVPETLMQPLEEIEKAFLELKDDPSFQKDYQKLLNDYSGRPTALTFADQLTKQLGGAKI
ncbi:tryptophan synthase subunit beta, partial [Bacillus sp. JR_15]